MFVSMQILDHHVVKREATFKILKLWRGQAGEWINEGDPRC